MVRAAMVGIGFGLIAAGSVAAQRPAAPPAAWPASAAEGDWPLPGRDYALSRFSPLGQITATNVVGLKPVWSFSTGQIRAHEGSPLVVGPTMYVHSPFPNAVFALDLAKPGAPILWTYAIPPAAARTVPPTGCCDVGSRGLGYHPSGKLFVPLLHGELAALDAKTGREIWRVRNSDGAAGATMPGAPLVVKDLVIVGTGGAEFQARGSMTAYEAATGRLVWRGFHTGPDAEILLDSEANFNYPSHRGGNLGVSSWPLDGWKRGGATASGWISYDPELDLIFYGTDRPGTYNGSLRPGDNKWAGSIFARSATTGKVRWIYQLTPHDEWGYDGSNENVLVDLTVAGRPVKALVHFDRNGFAYTFDRATGKMLLAERFGPANWATRVDLVSGQPQPDPRFAQRAGKTAGICPAAVGSKGLEPAAYSPVTGLFYLPTSNLCMDLTPLAPGPAARPNNGATIKMMAGPGPNLGRFIAWDAAAGTIAWQVQEAYPVTGGALVTAGGLVFYGTMDGWLKAVDHKTGNELWRFKTPSGIVGAPIAFTGPDRRQYIAVLSGLGGWIGSGANGAFPTVTAISPTGGTLLVFGL